jgi:hypothetical protein
VTVTTQVSKGNGFGLRRGSLVAVELVIAANAVYGGIGLMRDGMGMPDEWLTPTPFRSWWWPGVFLLLVIAVPMGTAAVMELGRHRCAYAASLAAGAAQVGWIVAQLGVLRRYFFLQPVLFCAGLIVVALAFWTHRAERGHPART